MQEAIDTATSSSRGPPALRADGAQRDARKELFTYRMLVGTAMIITAGNFPRRCPRGRSSRRCCAATRGVEAVAKTRHGRPGAHHAGDAGGVPRVWSTRCTARARRIAASGDRAGPSSRSSVSPAPPAVGRRIGESCGRNLQIPCLELGGKNPMVVMPDADLDNAVEGALFGAFGTAGQRCTSLAPVETTKRSTRSSRRTRRRGRARRGRRPDARRAVRPAHRERYPPTTSKPDLTAEHHTMHGSTGPGGSPLRTRAPASSATLRRACSRTRRRGGRHARDALDETGFRPLSASVASTPGRGTELANGHGYGFVVDLHDARQSVWRFRFAGSARAWYRSTTPPPAPRRTCPSAATESGNGRARAACGCSTSSPAGRR